MPTTREAGIAIVSLRRDTDKLQVFVYLPQVFSLSSVIYGRNAPQVTGERTKGRSTAVPNAIIIQMIQLLLFLFYFPFNLVGVTTEAVSCPVWIFIEMEKCWHSLENLPLLLPKVHCKPSTRTTETYIHYTIIKFKVII